MNYLFYSVLVVGYHDIIISEGLVHNLSVFEIYLYFIVDLRTEACPEVAAASYLLLVISCILVDLSLVFMLISLQPELNN